MASFRAETFFLSIFSLLCPFTHHPYERLHAICVLAQSEKQEQDYVTAEIRVCVLGYWNHFYRVVSSL